MRNSIIELINAIKLSPKLKEEKADDFEFLINRLEKLPNYVNRVYMMNLKMPILRAKYDEPSELEYHIRELDEKRRIAHDSAIDACKQINRMAKTYNCQNLFCPIELENVAIDSDLRHNIAVFIGEFVNEVFKDEIMDRHNDISKAISDAQIKSMKEELDDEFEL